MMKVVVTETCDRCGVEVVHEHDERWLIMQESAEQPDTGLIHLHCGGKSGMVCKTCMLAFAPVKAAVNAYRDKLYADFWAVNNG